MVTRQRATAIALGSVRAEGLEPEPEVVELLDRWGRAELSDAAFDEALKTLAAQGHTSATCRSGQLTRRLTLDSPAVRM